VLSFLSVAALGFTSFSPAPFFFHSSLSIYSLTFIDMSVYSILWNIQFLSYKENVRV